jgi:protein-L-isoaspartate(D-aspartate) O-methyltransferase
VSSHRPRTLEREAERSRLAALLSKHGIRDARVLEAIRNVPRHWFVPERLEGAAYDDDALPIGAGQTISQPYIVALMTEILELAPGEKVLEVGTGSGYQAAVLSELTPDVLTIEVLPEIAERARSLFSLRGYGSIRSRTGNGWLGWPEEAPFDAVLVSAAPDEIPPALFAQLKPGGRMSVPVGRSPAEQSLFLVRKEPDGTLAKERIAAVRFVPMTGEKGSET